MAEGLDGVQLEAAVARLSRQAQLAQVAHVLLQGRAIGEHQLAASSQQVVFLGATLEVGALDELDAVAERRVQLVEHLQQLVVVVRSCE